MNFHPFSLAGASLRLLPSGAVHWPAEALLCVADLHLGKSERMARRGGAMLPPYEGRDTLARLAADIAATGANRVLCLGDSFDDDDAAKGIDDETRAALKALAAGRDWIWIAGNHDPAARLGIGEGPMDELHIGALVFRHIAEPGAHGEVSGHYHPKARLRTRARAIARRCMLLDPARAILPAYGTYTGGLYCDSEPLASLMGAQAQAVMLGPRPCAVPMPRLRHTG